ncbi:helix-turn-helix domain-containing protein (plasmid) [Tistrella mobilis]|uniref:AraC-like ligand-binding domain-containing protein n=1 Tax=Tistrella mobilis TaxID=171437 RepID=UPI003558915D
MPNPSVPDPELSAAAPTQAAGVVRLFGADVGAHDAAFEGWRLALDGVFDVSRPRDGGDPFRGGIVAHDFGQAVITETHAGNQRFRRDGRTIARGGLDHFLVQLYRQGGFDGEAEGREMAVRPGDVCLFDLSRTMQTDAGQFRNVTLLLPRALLAPLVDTPDDLHGLVLDGSTGPGRILAAHLQSLVAQGALIDPADAGPVMEGTAGLIAGCFRRAMALAGPTDGEAAHVVRHGVRDAVLGAMHRFIDANLTSPELTPDALMQRFHISRPTLYRLFESSGGVVAHIRARRLRRCFAAITDPAQAHRRLSDIAYDWGFTDDTAFARAFRRSFGLSPRDARRAALEARAAGHHDGTSRALPGGDPGLQRLIRQLRTV